MTRIIGQPLQAYSPSQITAYPSTTGDVYSAAREEAIATNPEAALENLSEGGYLPKPASKYEWATGAIPREEKPPEAMYTVEQANEKFKDYGLSFDKPVSKSYADTLAVKKQKEIERSITFQRSRGGFAAGSATIAGGLVGSMESPINFSLNFVPVVGQAKYAKMVSALGTRGARLTTGAIEGAVGAAIAEPLVYAGAQAAQYDYGGADSLMNVAFGTVLGGGLHFAGGEIKDKWVARKKEALNSGVLPTPETIAERIDALPPRERGDVMRTAVAQAANGERIDVENWLGALEDRVAPRPKESPDFELGDFAGNRYANYTKVNPQQRKYFEGVLAELLDSQKGAKIFNEVDGQGSTPDVIGYSGNAPEWYTLYNKQAEQSKAARAEIAKRNATLPDNQKQPLPAVVPVLTRAKAEKVVRKVVNGKPLGKEEGEIAKAMFSVAKEMRTANVKQMVDYRANRQAEYDASIDAVAEREAAAWEDYVRDEENVIKQYAAMDEDLNALLQDMDAMINAERSAGTLSEDDIAAIDSANQFEVEAENGARGLIAAATCIYRKV